MFAVYAESFSPEDPLSGLVVGERPDPDVPDGWTTVTVKAAALNHHDIWTLRGVGIKQEQLPMIVGCDAAGVDEDGNEVVVHAVISDPAWRRRTRRWTRGGRCSSERYQGTFADKVAVPRGERRRRSRRSLSFEEAACLPTAWLTAYRMLFVQGGCKPGDTVLVQGAGGGVATALIALARAGGLKVLATSRDETKRQRALELGAHEVYETGQRLPTTVDAVMETVGQATWLHSIRSLRAGGTLVTSGATSGNMPADMGLTRIFFLQLRVVGSTMGTRGELASLISMMDATGVRPRDRPRPPDGGRAPGLRGDGGRRRLREDRLHAMKVLLTGAGSGVGQAVADVLHGRGDDLVLLARNEQRAADIQNRYAGADVRVADLAEPESTTGAVEDPRPPRRARARGRSHRARPARGSPARAPHASSWRSTWSRRPS